MRSGFITVFSGSCAGPSSAGSIPSRSANSYDHRRTWIRDRLESLAGLFGVEIAAFAVMSNHLHVILRNRPDVVTLSGHSGPTTISSGGPFFTPH
jgi:hypothetical protein